jgi:L-alanine-DL-glutamate epimerase-like enolase superfamily enzyme
VDLRASVATITTREPFVIARGVEQDVEVVRVALTHDGVTGHGEGSPLARYGEDAEGGVAWLEAQPLPPDPLAFHALDALTGHQAAKAALDGALHDLAGKLLGVPVWRLLGLARTCPPTRMTVWLADPDAVALHVERLVRDGRFRALKLKLGGDGLDVARVGALRRVTALPLLVDANEAFPDDAAALETLLPLERLGLDGIEQPLPVDAMAESRLRERLSVPLFVDESCHTLADVAACAGVADGINVKLAKSGGIREALRMVAAARALGLRTLLGCMVESGLGIAAAAQIASLFGDVDLDGNLLLARDPWPGVELVGGAQLPAAEPGLGVTEQV